jgi:hypothetical protein
MALLEIQLQAGHKGATAGQFGVEVQGIQPVVSIEEI